MFFSLMSPRPHKKQKMSPSIKNIEIKRQFKAHSNSADIF